jgi:hypothetical protein
MDQCQRTVSRPNKMPPASNMTPRIIVSKSEVYGKSYRPLMGYCKGKKLAVKVLLALKWMDYTFISVRQRVQAQT